LFAEHPTFVKPANDAVLWRYMDFTKFVSLIDKNALFFARSDKLGDPFEGSYSRKNLELRPEIYKEIPLLAAGKIGDIVKNLRKVTLINCWHQSDVESAAMWKLYSQETNGIAIKSNFGQLSQSFNCEEDVYIGQVEYINYDNDFIPEQDVISPFLRKRKSFEHEREVRALTWHPQTNEEGIDLFKEVFEVGAYHSVDLSILIQEIIVAPYAEEWYADLVRSVVEHYKLDTPVLNSKLSEPPVWR